MMDYWNMECKCSNHGKRDEVCDGNIPNDKTEKSPESCSIHEYVMSAVQQGRYKDVQNVLSYISCEEPLGINIFNLLNEAVHRNMVCIVKLLAPIAGNDLNRLDNDGCSLLYWALSKANKSIVECLMKAGADVNVENKQGKTALHYVVSKSWIKKRFSKKKNEIFIKNFSVAFTELFITNGADVNFCNKEGFTPIQEAVWEENIDAVRLLLKYGANINSNSRRGTPLHIAVLKGNLTIIKTLLESGAKVGAVNVFGDTSLHLALQRKNFSLAMFFSTLADVTDFINITNAKGDNVLHVAVKSAPVDLVEVLVAKGADVNFLNNNGDSPLMHLVMEPSSVKQNYCFDPKTFDNSHSCRLSNIAKLLIRSKCNLNARNMFKHSVFHNALMGKRLCVMKTLLSNSIDQSLLNELLFSAFNFLFSPEIYILFIKNLVEFGADVNARRVSDGQTPLHKATFDVPFYTYQYETILGYMTALINLGADVNSVDMKGETPLHIALLANRGDESVWRLVNILLDSGANINIKSNGSFTPLDLVEELEGIGFTETYARLIKESCYSYALMYFALGWQSYIDKNRISHEYILRNSTLFTEYQKEVNIMKSIKVDNVSLYDFIHPDNYLILHGVRHDFLKNIDKYLVDIKMCRSIVKTTIIKISKRIERELILNSGKTFLNFIAKHYELRTIALQDCYDNILKYLCFNDYRNLYLLQNK